MEKERHNKNNGTLIVVTVLYLLIIGLSLALKYFDDISASLQALLSLGFTVISLIIPIATNLVLKKRNGLSWIWVGLSIVIIILRYFGITAFMIVARELVESNIEAINNIYNGVLGSVVYYVLLYLTSLVSVFGKKKTKKKTKKKDPYGIDKMWENYDPDEFKDKVISEYLY